MKKAIVCGAGGFIAGHLVKKLKREGCWVRGVDIKEHEYAAAWADEFLLLDLREDGNCQKALTLGDGGFDEVYQLAADMGGAGYVFTGEHDADVMHNSAQINLNVARFAVKTSVKKLFFSSSACVYPEYNQTDPDNPKCSETSTYPAAPDSEYGWEKLFSERMYLAFHRNYKLDVRIARFHNIFGPEGAWNNGKEKAPAAICRKVAEAKDGGSIEVWGDGKQTRSFLYIDECLEGVRRLMDSDFIGPVNIGSEEMVSINNLAEIAMSIAGKKLTIEHVEGPVGVRGRNSDNDLIMEKLNWKPLKTNLISPLYSGMEKLYKWIEEQLHGNN